MWARVNWLAHGSPSDLTTQGPGKGRLEQPPLGSWAWAVDELAREIVDFAQGNGSLIERLQRECMIPLEMALLNPQFWPALPARGGHPGGEPTALPPGRQGFSRGCGRRADWRPVGGPRLAGSSRTYVRVNSGRWHRGNGRTQTPANRRSSTPVFRACTGQELGGRAWIRPATGLDPSA